LTLREEVELEIARLQEGSDRVEEEARGKAGKVLFQTPTSQPGKSSSARESVRNIV
jgi:hypothetical protein